MMSIYMNNNLKKTQFSAEVLSLPTAPPSLVEPKPLFLFIMPTPSSPPTLLSRLSSTDHTTRLKALREVKNQIIGNRTRKLSYINLGLVPAIATTLTENVDCCGNAGDGSDDCFLVKKDLVVQAAAALGSFACGVDDGVRAVVEAGALPGLLRLIESYDEKVVDAGARSLKMIYQSKFAPKYDFLKDDDMGFLLSLLNSENENVSGLGACIITHSCETGAEQKALWAAGALAKLIGLLDGSLSQRDASLEAITAVIKNNMEIVSKFVDFGGGRALNSVIELTKDKNPRTRLLASLCLIAIRSTSPCLLQDLGIKIKMVHVLLELLDDPGGVGDEAPFAFSRLISEKEDWQKIAYENNAIDKLQNHLHKGPLHPKRVQGLLLALADLCSMLEDCRSRFLSLQVMDQVTDALIHDNADVRAAACVCLKSVFRSLKNLCAGRFIHERIVITLLNLLHDPCTPVQVAALSAISNVVVDFTMRKSTFIQNGGIKQLVESSKSMDSTVRSNALVALKNFVFLRDKRHKDEIFLELTALSLASLICDPEPSVQEQSLALVRNLVDGCINSIEYVFKDDSVILDAVGRQMQSSSRAEIGIQGMYVLANVASGNEYHKEAVMHQVISTMTTGGESFMIKFLQSNNSLLRTATIWVVVNLTIPASPGAFGRVIEFRNAGLVTQLRSMANDPCPDVKLRVRTALSQCMTFSDGSN